MTEDASGLQPVRVGLIGAGRWGRVYIRTLRSMLDLQLMMVASRNTAIKELVGSDCMVVENWSAVIASSEIDGVIIASPPHVHAEMVLAAVRTGKSVLVEKPLVCDITQAREIYRELDSAPVSVLVEQTHLFHAGFQDLVRRAAEIGTIKAIRSSAGNHGPYRSDVSVLWDWGSHDVAMCLALAPGDWVPETAECLEYRVVESANAETIRLVLRGPSNLRAQIEVSTLVDKHRWFAVDFENETLIYTGAGDDFLVRYPYPGALPDQVGETLVSESELPLTVALRTFGDMIRRADRSRSSLKIGVQTVELLSQLSDKLHLPVG